MSSVLELATDLLSKNEKPAYVEFSQVAKEVIKFDPETGKRIEGHYRAKDVDMVTVRQIGSVDSCIFEAEKWLKQQAIEAQSGRLPRQHLDYYRKAYQSWKEGRELPVEGTPIRGWAMISPSQAEIIIRAGVRTVEDLSTCNAEACTRIGMGAVKLKQTAAAWIAQAQDKGPLTAQMVSLQQENDLLKAQLEKLTTVVEELRASAPYPSTAKEEAIHADDILDDIQPERKRSARTRKDG
jgi:hypothetical protein